MTIRCWHCWGPTRTWMESVVRRLIAQGASEELIKRVEAPSAEIARLTGELAEAKEGRDILQSLFDRWHERDMSIIHRWRREGKVALLTQPDYVNAAEMLADERDKAEADLAAAREDAAKAWALAEGLKDALVAMLMACPVRQGGPTHVLAGDAIANYGQAKREAGR